MSDVKLALFRELRQYTLDEIRGALGCTSENADKYINKLRKYGIVKLVKKGKLDYSDLTNDDLILADSAEDISDSCYKFDFVGVAAVQDKVFFCYPKYIANENCENFREEFKLAIRAIRKKDSKGELVHLHNGDEKGHFNRLALALHVLQDYFDNGIYTNTQEIIETNGDGEIDWNRTINETFAYIKNNYPYYLELRTLSSQNDDFDYFKRLHECIVTQCSKYLEDLTLLDIFDFPKVLLSEHELNDFGDSDYIRYRLEREISTQFVTRKQNLLKTLYTFVAESSTSAQENSYSLYGTNSMNLVWEDACGAIFGNIYDEIKSEITKPKWQFKNSIHETNTLIPDIVTKCSIGDNNVFCILDGKYYIIKTEDSISGNPGVEDIIKQFAYYDVLRDYLHSQPGISVFNAFLFPLTDEKNIEGNIYIRGFVTMQKWRDEEIVPIYLVFLKPSFVWNNYLKGSNQNQSLAEAMKKIRLEDVFRNVLKYPDTLQYME